MDGSILLPGDRAEVGRRDIVPDVQAIVHQAIPGLAIRAFDEPGYPIHGTEVEPVKFFPPVLTAREVGLGDRDGDLTQQPLFRYVLEGWIEGCALDALQVSAMGIAADNPIPVGVPAWAFRGAEGVNDIDQFIPMTPSDPFALEGRLPVYADCVDRDPPDAERS